MQCSTILNIVIFLSVQCPIFAASKSCVTLLSSMPRYSFYCIGWLCGYCFVALPSCGEIDVCFFFIAEIASLACSNKLAFLVVVNLSTESDMDIATD